MAQLTRKESSAGGVVFRRMPGVTEVLLIPRNRPACRQAGRKAWCLPKGKIEKNELPQDAAAREIKEETGVSGKITGLLGDIYYKFISPQDKARVWKDVRFFLFEYECGSIVAQKEEIDDAAWFNIDEALKIMAYPSERKIMQQAKRGVPR